MKKKKRERGEKKVHMLLGRFLLLPDLAEVRIFVPSASDLFQLKRNSCPCIDNADVASVTSSAGQVTWKARWELRSGSD